MNKENEVNNQNYNLFSPNSLQLPSSKPFQNKKNKKNSPNFKSKPDFFNLELEKPFELEPFAFTKERTDSLLNNLNLLQLLDSKKVLFYGESSNLEEMNERFQRVAIKEEEIESLDLEEFKGVMKYCQASIELYNYFQNKENNEIMNKHQEYQSLMEIKKVAAEKQVKFKAKLEKLNHQLSTIKAGLANLHENSKKFGVFKCPICQDKFFKTKPFLEKHLLRRHDKQALLKEKEIDLIKKNENIDKSSSEIIISEVNPQNFNENKFITEITSKLTDELAKVQINLQHEFNEKLKGLEEQNKISSELLKNTFEIAQITNKSQENNEKTIEKNEKNEKIDENSKLNELIRLNEAILASQTLKEKQVPFEKVNFGDYNRKLRRLNKLMKLIVKENSRFQREFFDKLKEINYESKKNLTENPLITRENDDLEDSPIKLNNIKGVIDTIKLNTHIGALESDQDSEIEQNNEIFSCHSSQKLEKSPIKDFLIEENQRARLESPRMKKRLEDNAFIQETPIIKEISPEKARILIENQERAQGLKELLAVEESHLKWLINNKYSNYEKKKFNWNERKRILTYGNQEFDLGLLDSFINDRLKEENKESFEEIQGFNFKTKKSIKIWDGLIDENHEIMKDFKEYTASKNLVWDVKKDLDKKEEKKEKKEKKGKKEKKEKKLGKLDKSKEKSIKLKKKKSMENSEKSNKNNKFDKSTKKDKEKSDRNREKPSKSFKNEENSDKNAEKSEGSYKKERNLDKSKEKSPKSFENKELSNKNKKKPLKSKNNSHSDSKNQSFNEIEKNYIKNLDFHQSSSSLPQTYTPKNKKDSLYDFKETSPKNQESFSFSPNLSPKPIKRQTPEIEDLYSPKSSPLKIALKDDNNIWNEMEEEL